MSPHLLAVRDLTSDGHTALQIARMLGITSGYVTVLRRKAREMFGADCMNAWKEWQ